MEMEKLAVGPVHPFGTNHSCWQRPSVTCVLQHPLVIPGMFSAESYNSCIVCHVIMWQDECSEAFGRLWLFTLQLKQPVINILLIVVRRVADAELHLNGLFH